MNPVEIKVATIKKSWYNQLLTISSLTATRAAIARPLGYVVEPNDIRIVWKLGELSYAKSAPSALGVHILSDGVSYTWRNPQGQDFTFGQLFL